MVPRPPLPAPPAGEQDPPSICPDASRIGLVLACGRPARRLRHRPHRWRGHEQGAAVPTLPVGDALNFTRDCPRTITIQAGWFPTADVAVPFQLLAGDYRTTPGRKRVAGPPGRRRGGTPGVDLEFRSGGPAVGFQNGPTLAYSDPAITMVFTNIDEMIATASKAPLQAVIAPVNGDPQSIIYDPQSHADFTSLFDIG